MSHRQAVSRAPTVALFVGVSLAGLVAYAPGCARGGATELSLTGGSSSSSQNTTGGGAPSSDAGSVTIVTPPVMPIGDLFAQSCAQGQPPTVGPSPLRRISRVEYGNLVRDLFSGSVDVLGSSGGTQLATQFVSETPMATGVNFETNTYTTVNGTTIPEQYLQAAETLATTAAASSNFGNWITSYSSSCSGNQQTTTCANGFIDAFATAAFRGQYDATEQTALRQLFESAQSAFSFSAGIQGVIEAVLTSPRFLFVLEYGQADAGTSGPVPLAPNELATRLSLFLWRSIPDATLLADASSGKLSTAAGMQSEVQRMLADSRAQSALVDFATQWMELQSTATATKDTQFTSTQAPRVPWSTQLAQDLLTETTTTIYNEVAIENGGAGGTLNELLTSGESYINGDLAQFYGVSGSGDGGTFTKTSVNPPGQTLRAGVLTNGSVMATQAHTSLPSPVLRGKLVREQVLCDPIPDPPAAVNGQPIPPPPSTVPTGETVNEAYVEHLTVAACDGCHQYMDPIGFGFANYDATGYYQTTDDNGQPNPSSYPAIDAGGQVLQAREGELSIPSFNGAVALATQLAGATQVQECYALEQFRYALGRLETTADSCSLQAIFQAFSQKNDSLQQVLIAIAQSPAFQYKNAARPGAQCQ
jgi:hypothetical protein